MSSAVISTPEDTTELKMLCELVHLIRAWWGEFEDTIRQLDQVAARKAYDAIIDATLIARKLARDMGFEIPDFSDIDWSASIPPLAHVEGANSV